MAAAAAAPSDTRPTIYLLPSLFEQCMQLGTLQDAPASLLSLYHSFRGCFTGHSSAFLISALKNTTQRLDGTILHFLAGSCMFTPAAMPHLTAFLSLLPEAISNSKGAHLHKNSDGVTALHLLVERKNLPFEVLQHWLEHGGSHSLAVADSLHNFPLHCALGSASSAQTCQPMQHIQLLAACWPPALLHFSRDGYLPLHSCCAKAGDPAAAAAALSLLSLAPETASMRTRDELYKEGEAPLPLHQLAQGRWRYYSPTFRGSPMQEDSPSLHTFHIVRLAEALLQAFSHATEAEVGKEWEQEGSWREEAAAAEEGGRQGGGGAERAKNALQCFCSSGWQWDWLLERPVPGAETEAETEAVAAAAGEAEEGKQEGKEEEGGLTAAVAGAAAGASASGGASRSGRVEAKEGREEMEGAEAAPAAAPAVAGGAAAAAAAAEAPSDGAAKAPIAETEAAAAATATAPAASLPALSPLAAARASAEEELTRLHLQREQQEGRLLKEGQDSLLAMLLLLLRHDWRPWEEVQQDLLQGPLSYLKEETVPAEGAAAAVGVLAAQLDPLLALHAPEAALGMLRREQLYLLQERQPALDDETMARLAEEQRRERARRAAAEAWQGRFKREHTGGRRMPLLLLYLAGRRKESAEEGKE